MNRQDPAVVRTRRVFYIPGYDPFPPRRYRELYRSEGQEQAAIAGYSLKQTLADGAMNAWRVDATFGQDRIQTRIDVLVWSDLVRDSMGASVAATYGQLVRTAWIYASTGAMWRLARLRKGPLLAMFYPVCGLLVQLAVAGLLAGAVILLLPGPMVLRLIVGLAFGAALLEICRRRDRRFFVYYLMHDFAHSAHAKGAYPADLDARIDRFVKEVADALAERPDEVLVVGHSSGAHIAVSLLGRLLRRDALAEAGPAIGLLSLGHVVPMISFLPNANALRDDLHILARSPRVDWVDVSAPADGCAFALCDPVAISGQGGSGQIQPLILSAAFSRSLSAERLKSMRWRFFRRHFQYICAFDRPKNYDFFAVTAGPLTLGRRYGGRRSSPSRIVAPVSAFVDRGA
ncbi:MAG: hypothetical protein AAF667_04305 [Pseudomonadota bacterium]